MGTPWEMSDAAWDAQLDDLRRRDPGRPEEPLPDDPRSLDDPTCVEPAPSCPLDTASADPAALSDTTLIYTITALQHQLDWAGARQARLLAELTARRPGTEPDRPTPINRWAPDEIALALNLSRSHDRRKRATRCTRAAQGPLSTITGWVTASHRPIRARLGNSSLPNDNHRRLGPTMPASTPEQGRNQQQQPPGGPRGRGQADPHHRRPRAPRSGSRAAAGVRKPTWGHGAVRGRRVTAPDPFVTRRPRVSGGYAGRAGRAAGSPRAGRVAGLHGRARRARSRAATASPPRWRPA
jgi:hypothetical protein